MKEPDSTPVGNAEAAELFAPVFNGASSILIAVSGGPDSMALMALLAGWIGRPEIAVATVDHGLRKESAAEASLVADAAQRLGLAHTTLVWRGEKPASGIQAAAREARYRLLLEHARRTDCSYIALGHHADDQAETVWMRLAAGSGITGLGGMAQTTGREGVVLARPFLTIPKARLIATCEALGIRFVEDPSNADMTYGRTRARAMLRQAADAGLSSERLNRLATRARRASEALDAMTRTALNAAGVHRTDCVTRLNWAAISAQPEEIRLRALIAVTSNEAPPRLERYEALLAEIDAAHLARKRIRRTIGDQIVTLQSYGTLIIDQAPARKRGTSPWHAS